MKPTENLCLPLTEIDINPELWAIGGKIGRAVSAQQTQITLKDSNKFPHQKQYPLKLEAWQGFIPLIKNLKEQGFFLIEFNSPWNTSVLGVQKQNGEWSLVQDLCPINEAVIPLHPVVPKPYSLLSQIPEMAAWFTVLDLKNVLFCIPLAQSSQFLFTLEDPFGSLSK